jgi:hypothetical protein
MTPLWGAPVGHGTRREWARRYAASNMLVFRKLMADAISYMRRPLRGENPIPQQNQDSILSAQLD